MKNQGCTISRSRCRRQRTGTVYVLVLGIGILLTVVGVSMVSVANIGVRSAAMDDAAAEAAVLAENAVEYALAKIASNSSWRSTYGNNTEITPIAFGRGTMSFKLVDEVDGVVSNNTTDPVRLYGIGRVRRATRIYSVECTNRPLNSLAVAVSCSGGISMDNASVQGSVTVSSNSWIWCQYSALNATRLESAGWISRFFTSGTGTYSSYVPSRQMPSSSAVLNYYVANGTRMTGVPRSSGDLQIKRVLISPTNNPFGGGTNARGIYYIDCGDDDVDISNVRIVGTLVLRNCDDVRLEGNVNWEPAVLGYPALIVQGNLDWRTDTGMLSESSPSPNVNLNPATTPFPYNYGSGGNSDTDHTDNYPTNVSGLVYVTGSLDSYNHPVLSGVILTGGGWSAHDEISLTYDSRSFTNPPPGFVSSAMNPQPLTWRWEAAP